MADLAKQLSPIFSRVSGNVETLAFSAEEISASEVQFSKALSPSSVRLESLAHYILLSSEQPLNASDSIFSTYSGIYTSCRALQSLKVLL